MLRPLFPEYAPPVIITAASPAAGAEFTAVNVLNMTYRFIGVRFRLVTDANAGNRHPAITILNSSAATALSCISSQAHGASLTRDYNFTTAPHGASYVAFDEICVAMPSDWIFPESWNWKITCVNLRAGDQISAIQPLLALYPESANAITIA